MRPGINKIKVRNNKTDDFDGIKIGFSDEHYSYDTTYEVVDVGPLCFVSNTSVEKSRAILPYIRKINECVTEYIDVVPGDRVILPYIVRESEMSFCDDEYIILPVTEIVAVIRGGKYKCYNGWRIMKPFKLSEEFGVVENEGRYYKGICVETGDVLIASKFASRIDVEDYNENTLIKVKNDYICAQEI